MKNKLIIVIVGLVLLFSCQDKDILMSLGDNYLNSQTTIALVDTISVNLSTFNIDSIATSGTSYVLAGSYTDNYFGTMSSSGYFQVEMPNSAVDDEEVFDSLVLFLPHSGISYGDTLKPQTINIHRVTEDIEEADDESYIFNTTTFAYDADPVGSITVKPKPNFHDNIEIRLDDDLGKEFLKYLIDDEDQLDGTSDFLDFFHGFVAVPGSENNSLLAFAADTSLKAVLYTHLIQEYKVEKSYTFSFTTTLNHSNHITADQTGTGLEQLTTQKEAISSSLLGNKAYIQGGMGIAMRADFLNISKVLEEERKNILFKAELVLRPVKSSENLVALPKDLVLYTTNKYNALESQLTDSDGNAVTATLNYDEFYNDDTYYSFDITDHIYQELSDGIVDPNSGLIIALADNSFRGTMDRVVFDTRSASQYRPFLKLYYVFYE